MWNSKLCCLRVAQGEHLLLQSFRNICGGILLPWPRVDFGFPSSVTSKKVAPEGSVDTAELCQLRFTLNLHRQPKTTTSHSWNWKNGIGEHWFVARCSKSSQVPMICLCESIRLFQRFWKSSFAFHSQAKPLAANKVDISMLTLYIMNGHEEYLCKQNLVWIWIFKKLLQVHPPFTQAGDAALRSAFVCLGRVIGA